MAPLLAHTQVNPIEWNEMAKQLEGSPFHSYEWSLFSSENNGEKPIYFRLQDHSGSIQSMSIGQEKARKIAGQPLIKTMSFGSLPAIGSPNYLRGTIEELIKYSIENGFMAINIHSFGTPLETEFLKDLGFLTVKRWEFLLNIDGSKDALWARLHSKKRNMIKKAQKEKLRVESQTELDRMFAFRLLAKETKERKDREGISFPDVEGEEQYRLLKSKLLDTGLGKLYLAYQGDICVAGAFFVGFNKKAYYMLSAANDQGLQAAAPDLILWTCMTDYQQEGYRIFNLGGVSEKELNGGPLEESGLFHFKSRFSAQHYLCYKGTLILRPKVYKLYDSLRKLKSIILH
jgi:hypothetical protein